MFSVEENQFYLTGQKFYTVMDAYGWVIAFCWTMEEAEAIIERLTNKKEQS